MGHWVITTFNEITFVKGSDVMRENFVQQSNSSPPPPPKRSNNFFTLVLLWRKASTSSKVAFSKSSKVGGKFPPRRRASRWSRPTCFFGQNERPPRTVTASTHSSKSLKATLLSLLGRTEMSEKPVERSTWQPDWFEIWTWLKIISNWMKSNKVWLHKTSLVLKEEKIRQFSSLSSRCWI